MGLLDYYKQFDGLSEEEHNRGLRAAAAERRAKALERVEPVDLSRTTWPGLPHPSVVGAITYAARRGLHRYVDPKAGALRSELAHRHGVGIEQVVVGNGAAQLLGAAATALLSPGDELVMPWPTYPLYPVLARRSHARAVPVADGHRPGALLTAVNEHTRLVVVANPNDPTGALLRAEALEELLRALPERVVVLLDEALVDYVSAQPVDACARLVADHPRLVVFRSFSKAWGLAGLRCGYAIAGPESAALLEQLEPDLGVNDLAQAGALEALRGTEDRVRRRAADVVAQTGRVADRLSGTLVEVAPTQANVLWMRVPGVDGTDLAARLETLGVLVAPGAPIGEAAYVRASVHRAEDGDRLVRALELATGAA